MGNIVGSDRFRGNSPVLTGSGGNDGGPLDDVLKRLSALETSVASIAAILPHLATKADINGLRADISSGETSVIKWMVGTVLAGMALAFGIAKYVS
jgi:hypothetical protein